MNTNNTCRFQRRIQGRLYCEKAAVNNSKQTDEVNEGICSYCNIRKIDQEFNCEYMTAEKMIFSIPSPSEDEPMLQPAREIIKCERTGEQTTYEKCKMRSESSKCN